MGKVLIRTLQTAAQVFVLAILITISHGQHKASALSPVVVSGTVTSGAINESGVTVYAYTSGTTTVVTSTSTLSDGSYSLSIAPGTYDFRFVPPTSTGLDSVVDSSVPVSGNMTISEQLTNTVYNFTGSLTDQSNNQLSGVTVQLTDLYGDKYTATTSGGSFSISAEPGSYTLTLSGNLMGNYSGTWYKDGSYTITQGSNAINLSGGSVAQNLVLPIANVTVSVYNPGWYPANDPFIRANATGGSTSLYAGDPGETISSSISTGNNTPGGVHTFQNIVGTTYGTSTGSSICGYNSTGSGALLGCLPSQTTISGNVSLSVPNTPPAPNTFSGILTDQNGTALSNVTMTLSNAYGSASTTTGVNGSFSISVEPGSYTLALSGYLMGNYSGTWYRDGSYTVTQGSNAINLSGGSVTQNLTLPIADVTVSIYNAGYYPVSDPYIRAVATGGSTSLYAGDPGETITSSIGTGNNIPTGTHTFQDLIGAMYSTTYGSSICGLNGGTGALISCISSPTTITGNESLSVPNVPPAQNYFSGTVTDQYGNAYQGVSVTLGNAYSNTITGTTGAGGSFNIAVEPGMYYIYSLSGTGTALGTFTLHQSSSNPSLNLTSGNLSQDLVIPVSTVDFTTDDASLTPMPYATASQAINTTTATTSLYSGDPGEYVSLGSNVTSNAQATGSFKTIIGVTYGTTSSNNSICESNSSNTYHACITAPLTIVSGINNVVIPTAPAGPAAPTGLYATSSASYPVVLNWNVVSGAAYYLIYRNSSEIGTSSNNSFNDTNVSSGTYSYYVVAVNSGGGESSPSSTVSFIVNLGPPSLGTVSWSSNPEVTGQSTTLATSVSGDLYGIIGGEYFIGSSDPGQGNGTPMTYANGVFTANIGSMNPGNYEFNVRAENGAGWGQVATSELYVQTTAPTNLTASSPTDLPILTWTSVPYASGYNVYRNGNMVGTSATTSYTDKTAPIGANTYYVTALNPNGYESLPSNTINVTYTGPYYTLSGQVIFNGTTTQGVQVDANASDGHSGYSVTNATGTYYVYNLPNDNYSVSVGNPTNPSNVSVTAANAPNYFTITSGSPFITINGQDLPNQNLAFTTNAVKITIKDGQGALEYGAYVKLYNTSTGLITSVDGQTYNLSTGNLTDEGYTNTTDGSVTMYVFPGVTYEICGYFPNPNNGTYSYNDNPACTQVTVTGDTSTEVDLPYAYTLSGNVSFGGTSVSANEAEVFVSSADGSIEQITFSDTSGNYTINNLPNGSYYVRVLSQSLGNGGYVPQYWNLNSENPSPYIAINSSNLTQNFAFATNEVQVNVIDGSGASIPANVYLTDETNNPITTSDGALTFAPNVGQNIAYGSESNGTITLGAFSGESYNVCAQTSTGTYCEPSYLTVNGNVSTLVIAAQTYTVSGSITLNGQAVPQTNPNAPSGAEVTLNNGIYSETSFTDTNGNFTIGNLINGNYTESVSYGNAIESSAINEVPNSFSLTSTSPIVMVNGSNLTGQNLNFATDPVVVYAYDIFGNPLSGSSVEAASASTAQVYTSTGSEVFTVNTIQATGTSTANGAPTFYLLPGVGYVVCAQIGGSPYCTSSQTVAANATTTIYISAAKPTGLYALPVTPYPQNPILTWNAVSGAVSYNVYRDGSTQSIGSSTTTSFTDSSANEGVHTYDVTAISSYGVQSAPSDSISVIVDRTAPVVASVAWTNNPSTFGATTAQVTADLTDTLTQIIAGEYYIGTADPGDGYGTSTSVINSGSTGGELTASFGGANYPPGTYTVNVRGENAAGIWSTVATTTLVVNLAPPTNLRTTGPTAQPPEISWDLVDGASYYQIYRNGTDVGSSNTYSFTDTYAPAGTNTYTALAVSLLGIESVQSSSISVLYDPNPPTITYTLSPTPNAAGWNNTAVTITPICADPTNGVVSCLPSPNVTVSQEGANQTVTLTAVDGLGGVTTSIVTVNIDLTPPTVGTPTLSISPIYDGQTTTLSDTAADNLSGVIGGEYFIGADPGAGNGTAMTWDGTNLTASLGSTLAPGAYTISVRSEDGAGNWGPANTVSLTVILAAPTNLTATSPTNLPVLSWTGSVNAVSYVVYRNSTEIGTTTGTTFADNGAPNGTNQYCVTGEGTNGYQSQAICISVVVNTVPPTTTASLSPNPYTEDGTYPDPTTVTLSANAASGFSVANTYYAIDGGMQQTYTAPFTVAGAGSHTITYWSVDNVGNVETAHTLTFTIHTNLPPSINALTSATITEGSTFSEPGTFSDYDSTSWTATVNYGDGSGTQQLGLSGTNFSLNHTYADEGTYTVTVSITDNQGASSLATATITVNNAPFTVGSISGIPTSPIQINSSGIASASASATFTDIGILDTHTAVWNWGDGMTSTGTVTESNGSGTVTGSHDYTAAGVYIVNLTVTDDDGVSVTQQFDYASVENPNVPGARISAGAIFQSPTGADTANPSLTRQVRFAIQVWYGSNNQPTGKVSMDFAAGNISFASTSFTELVCSASGIGTIEGTGTVNGVSGYTFLVTGIDSSQTGGNTIRYKIMDAAGNVIYDTQPGAADNAAPTTVVSAGQVIVKG